MFSEPYSFKCAQFSISLFICLFKVFIFGSLNINGDKRQNENKVNIFTLQIYKIVYTKIFEI